MGTDANGPNPMLGGGEEGQPPGGEPGGEGQGPPPQGQGQEQASEPEQPGRRGGETYGQAPKAQAKPLPEPTEEELRDYDLQIMDFSSDEEETDVIELDDF